MIDILDSTFSELVGTLISNCAKRGVIMIDYEKLRNSQTRALYWKQGRTKNQVK